MDRPIMYGVVTAFKPRELEDLLLFEMNNGWRAYGGVSVAYLPDNHAPLYFAQAIVKYVEDLTPEELEEYNNPPPPPPPPEGVIL
jgi:hypothetical protein